MLKAERGLVLLYDRERRQLVGQAPGFGLTPEQVQRVRYSVDGEADVALELPQERAAALEQGPGRHAAPAGAGDASCGLQSLMVAPITRGPQILGPARGGRPRRAARPSPTRT